MANRVTIAIAGVLAAAALRAGEAGAATPSIERPSREEIRKQVERVYKSEEFQTEIEAERKRLNLPAHSFSLPEWLGEVVAWVFIIGTLALLAVAALSAALWVVKRRREADDKQDPGEVPVTVPIEDARRALSDAEILASGREYIDAVRRLFMEAAGHIEKAHRIALAEHETNGEYLRRFDSKHPFRHVVSLLSRTVDSCFYGSRECTERDWFECRKAWVGAMGGDGGNSGVMGAEEK
jgi:hypothetical protein